MNDWKRRARAFKINRKFPFYWIQLDVLSDIAILMDFSNEEKFTNVHRAVVCRIFFSHRECIPA